MPQAERARVHAEGTLCYLRYGGIPSSGCSRNAASGGTEAGVSVYPAYRFPGGRYVMDLDGCEFSAVWLTDRPVYIVTGTIKDIARAARLTQDDVRRALEDGATS